MSDLLAYTDGNNNCWEIEADCIKYKAVSKSMSSSGIYSGGIDKIIHLNESQKVVFNILVENAIQDIASHSEKRTMGSALLKFIDRQIVLNMQSKVKIELDIFFEGLI